MSLPSIAALEFDPAIEAAPATVHKTYDWDFDTGDFTLMDGKLVELTGIEYLKVWIQKVIRTVKDSLIYAGENYGSEHHSLIGRNFKPDFMRSEMERMIREALLKNNAISQVENFTFSQVGSGLEIAFKVSSIYGTTDEAVTASV